MYVHCFFSLILVTQGKKLPILANFGECVCQTAKFSKNSVDLVKSCKMSKIKMVCLLINRGGLVNL